MKETSNTLFINTGSGKNLGDRAMLLNLILMCNAKHTGKIYVSDDLPQSLADEVKALKYPLLYHCFGRFNASQHKVLSKGLLTGLSTLFALMVLLVRLIKQKPLKWHFMEAQLANAIVDSDTIVFCGGGYLTDKGMLECRASLITGLFGVLAGKRLLMTGQGIGPLDSFLSRLLLKHAAKNAEAIMVRDPRESKKLLIDLGVKSEKIFPIGDDAFTLPIAVIASESTKKEKKRLAVHFRISNFTSNAQNIAEWLLRVLEEKEQQGWHIRFFIFSENSKHEKEIIQQRFMSRLNTFEVIESADPRQLKSNIAECQLAIGIAYHFLVFGLTTGVPTIGLYDGNYYKQKVCGLFSWFKMEHMLLAFSEATYLEIAKKLDAAYNNRQLLQNQMRDHSSALSKNCQDFYAKHL